MNELELNGEIYIKKSSVTPEYKEQLGKENLHPFHIGRNYFIRTVTMIFIGKLEQVLDNELILSTAAWIPDTGRFMNFLKDGEKAVNEIEPFQNDVIIGRGSIIDATIWNHNSLVSQK